MLHGEHNFFNKFLDVMIWINDYQKQYPQLSILSIFESSYMKGEEGRERIM